MNASTPTPPLPPVPGLPRAADDPNTPVFNEPWEAKGFAIVLALHQRGLFTWNEWAKALAEQIGQAQQRGDADLGDTYYRHWVAALESLVARKGASSASELERYRQAWDHAADRTPHGAPIELSPADFDADSPR
jgi:nitrile hydratase accessory protein